MSKIPKTFNQVKALMEKFPVLRDNDSRLVVNQWIDEIKLLGFDLGAMKATDLLTIIKDEKLTPFDSISRARRLVEETHIELRGKSWAKRQAHKQDEVKTEIRTIKDLHENYQKKEPTGNDLLAQKYQQMAKAKTNPK
jgi:hypothetical protein